MDIQELFHIGMKREIPQLLPSYGVQAELGPGFSPYTPSNGTMAYFEWPEWDADYDRIPVDNETFDVVHMYHFLEHVKYPDKVLREVQRILKKGGHVNIVVPHYMSDLAHEDLDHKHFFTEESWRKLFNNNGYDKHNHGWKFRIHANFLMAVAFRNLSIFTQLVKE